MTSFEPTLHEWRAAKLGAAAGLTVRQPKPFRGSRPYLATADVNHGAVLPSEEFTFENRPARAGLQLAEGDVLQAKMMATNKALLVCDYQAGWLASTGFGLFSPREAGSVPAYFYHWLQSNEFHRQKDRLCVGSTQKAISQADLAAIALCVPEPPEQVRIAAVLGIVDDAIAKTEEVIAKLKQVRAGLLHDLLARGLDEYGQLRDPVVHPEQFQDSPLGRIPREWGVYRVGELAHFINGNSFDVAEWSQEGLPIIRIENLNGEPTFNYYAGAVDPRWLVESGELLFAWSGTRETSFGPRIWLGPRGVLNQHIFRVLENRERVSRSFLHLLLAQNLELIAKSAHGFKQSFVHVTRGELTGVAMALPIPREQDRIIDLVEIHHKLITTEQYELTKLRSVRASLMTDLLTGRVRVPESMKVIRR